jgi:cytochrome c oxidase cbb3-type subunit 4
MTIDMETVRGLGTLFLMSAFLGLCVWAYWPGNKRRFEEDALLPFREDELERTGGNRE